jgi:23S rRNA (guanosine2251-2'-O)-methyltransferase
VQADRQDKRMQALCELSRNQGVSVLSCAKSELDALVIGRHQGVVAVLDHGGG